MSGAEIWRRVRAAWSMLSPERHDDVSPGRERPGPADPAVSEARPPELRREGFTDEALPWMDAVYRFALRLTRGDRDAADDLVQETFVAAYRAWHTFRPGSNARSWLFTICRNAFLRSRGRGAARHEVPATDLGALGESSLALPVEPVDPRGVFGAEHLDAEVTRAIDALPEEFREVLVLSDLGDLKYAEIAHVLDLPIGTVRSRLFRARRQLQERLLGFAREAGYVKGHAASQEEG